MNTNIEMIRSTRRYLLELTGNLTIDEWNTVPPGFNNNSIWNLAHLIAAQQGVCYLRAGRPATIDDAFYLAYKPGTKPDGTIDEAGIETIKEMLMNTLDSFERDYEANLFTAYTTWTTRYGVTLSNIDEALQFLLFHEGLHTGYIMALKRVVKKG